MVIIMRGCLCIHGFTGSPNEVKPLAEFLRKQTDWKIVVPILPGHEENGTLKGVKYSDWLDFAEDELRILLDECEEVMIIGFSMGGIIACSLASRYPVGKLVLLSAAAQYINPKQLGMDIVEMLRDAYKGKLKSNPFYRRYKDKIIKTPISAAMQFRLLVNANRDVFKSITIPTFIAQGTKDGIVPPKSAEFLFEQIASKDKEMFFADEAKHLICHWDKRDELFEKVLLFLGGSQE